VLLLGVSLLQFLERMPDRQAVELLTYHLGWQLALRRQPGQAAFHPTTLSYFRDRLIAHEQGRLVWDQILQGLVEAGLVPRKAAQRLDSTQRWGLLRQMNRLECLRASLRLALHELADYPHLSRPAFWPELWARYVEGKLDHRLSSGARRAQMDQAGADAARLLHWVEGLGEPAVLAGPRVQVLKRVLAENFELSADGPPVPRPAQPPGAVNNPHEPEAQWAAKGQGANRKEHVGYKLQVAETLRDTPLAKGEPTRNFLSAILTQPATASDEAGHREVEAQQAEQPLEPPPAW
jgi:transposase